MASLTEQFSDQLALVGRTWRLFTLDVVGLLLASALILVTATIVVNIVGVPLAATGLIHNGLADRAWAGLAFAAIGGPLVGGLCAMLLHMVRQGSRVPARAVFHGYRRWPTLSATGLLTVAAVTLTDAYQWPGQGALRLLAVPGFALAVGVVYVLPTAVDRGAGFRRAVSIAVRLLRKGELGRTAVGVAFLVLAEALCEGLPRALLGASAAIAIGLSITFVALPLVAGYVTCMYLRACNLDHLIDETFASGLATRSAQESASRRRHLPKWAVATLAVVGIVVVVSLVVQAILRP